MDGSAGAGSVGEGAVHRVLGLSWRPGAELRAALVALMGAENIAPGSAVAGKGGDFL